MQNSTILMLLILVLGIWGRSNIIAAAAGILLVLQFINLHTFLPILERRGLEIGLVFLVIAVLVPFASGRVSIGEIIKSFLTLPGVIAIISGALATILNGHGLSLLQREPYLMIGLVVGSIIGVITFGGIPVGPLMAGGIAALLLQLAGLIR
ncbi:DUF441 domain-containing protein [Zhaonella formicivorans]|uniref:DUF441 domain-containing protein n=1 Tax=Zhaonella formicivorans TaxID=2528593 RepID=UPI0010D045EA|nr:DUF441 domain-containing protein [Zhaonella formicivorans]